ncbi:hypothetical protein PPYR_01891 [Photinus pyralis]|uniref:Uncharacterized protein n=1 Tax=Photinus pyralis TaxID=7054 RepID=A0A1Y1MFM6_PHOPY|nr:putative odorant-binding protein A10 [Photinus pyralis]KAB0804921.1 hypothetical protein PPYR_01891 [Photinus pyralis]
MKLIISLGLFALFACVWAAYEEFDGIDIEEILNSPRLVDNYIKCAKTGQKCSTDAQKMKAIVPGALKSKCPECSEEQKAKIQRVFEWVIQNRPQDFLEIEKIHDPEHHYRADYADELAARNIVLPAPI